LRWDWTRGISDCQFPIADLTKRPRRESISNRHSEIENGMKRKAKTYTISAVADQYNLHPQTLRLYEREGLLKPSRSEGNTRLYTDPDLERLELILSLTRDLGVNLAGVEIILNMREKMDAMQREFERFFQYLQSHAEELTNFAEPPAEGTSDALVPLTRVAALRRRSASRT
jgi:MerR family transcriptional regulator, heat shock protein HspR